MRKKTYVPESYFVPIKSIWRFNDYSSAGDTEEGAGIGSFMRGPVYGCVGFFNCEYCLAIYAKRSGIVYAESTMDHQRVLADIWGIFAAGWSYGGPVWETQAFYCRAISLLVGLASGWAGNFGSVADYHTWCAGIGGSVYCADGAIVDYNYLCGRTGAE